MSTSIQEQDLIQRIKDLQQRISDLERQQREIGSGTISAGSYVTFDALGIEVGERGTGKTNVRLNANGKVLFTYEGGGFLLYESYIEANQEQMRLGGDGTPWTLVVDGQLIIGTPDSNIPATTTSAGAKGEIKWNGTHLYLCTAANTWRRVALTTW
jgi:hypothetical protein